MPRLIIPLLLILSLWTPPPASAQDATPEQALAELEAAKETSAILGRSIGQASRMISTSIQLLGRLNAHIEAAEVIVSGLGSGPVDPDPPRPGRFERFDAHDSATRTSGENKAAFLPPLRASRLSTPREQIEGQVQYYSGQAPDIGDVDLFVHWQKGVGVSRDHYSVLYTGDALAENAQRRLDHQVALDAWNALPAIPPRPPAPVLDLVPVPAPGSIPKNGNIDIARMSIQPHPTWLSSGSPPFNPRNSMKWGMRRYNLGDSTVIDCDFSDIPEEHGIYDDVAGHALYQGLTFSKLGAQSLQIMSRDRPYSQYLADNMPLTGKPSVVVENCHAVDGGYFAAKRAFCWTFFDWGTLRFPGTIVIRDSSWVASYAPRVKGTNQPTHVDDPLAVQASKGLVVTQYDNTPVGPDQYTTEDLVVTNCLFDGTQCEASPIVIRGVENILFDHSTFIFRFTDQNWVGIDSPGKANRSGTLVVQDCLSPTDTRLWLYGQPLMYQGQPFTMHCPGKRFEIDCRTRVVEEVPMSYDRIIDFKSPLLGRGGDLVPSGFTPQPADAVLDMGTVPYEYAGGGR